MSLRLKSSVLSGGVRNEINKAIMEEERKWLVQRVMNLISIVVSSNYWYRQSEMLKEGRINTKWLWTEECMHKESQLEQKLLLSANGIDVFSFFDLVSWGISNWTCVVIRIMCPMKWREEQGIPEMVLICLLGVSVSI